MEPGPLTGQHLLVDRLAHQRVAEGVRGPPFLDAQHVMVDRVLQGVVELVPSHAGHHGEQPMADPLTGGRHRLEKAAGLGRHRLDPRQEDVAQSRAKAAGSVVAPGRGQLLDEEGVAFGALEDDVDQAGRRRLAQDAAKLLGHLASGERGELDPLDVGQPLDLGKEPAQGMLALHILGAIGRHQQDAVVAKGPGQEGQQVEGGAVGPMDVLDDQHERLLRGQTADQSEDQLEQPTGRAWIRVGGAGCVRIQLGEEPGQVATSRPEQRVQFGRWRAADENPERFHDGHEGHALAAQFDASAGQHARASLPGDAIGRLPDEAALADAGLAGHDHDARFARGASLERRHEAGHFAVASHEHRAHQPSGHGGQAARLGNGAHLPG